MVITWNHIRLILIIALLSSLPVDSMARSPSDSTMLDRDSIQDARMDRIERSASRTSDRVDGTLKLLTTETDSLDREMTVLKEQVEKLDREKQSLDKGLQQVTRELEILHESSTIFRERLQLSLWLSSAILLLLLSASFAILRIYGIRTRHLMDLFGAKQRQDKKELSRRIANQEDRFMGALKALKRRFKMELRKRNR